MRPGHRMSERIAHRNDQQSKQRRRIKGQRSEQLAGSLLSQLFSCDPEERKKGIRGLVVAIIVLGLLIHWIAKDRLTKSMLFVAENPSPQHNTTAEAKQTNAKVKQTIKPGRNSLERRTPYGP